MKKYMMFTIWMVCFFFAAAFCDDLISEADRFFQASDWQNAAKAYTEVVKGDPSNAQAWFKLGRALHETGKYQDALKALDEAQKEGFPPLVVFLRRAKAFSRMGDSKAAMDQFKQAVDLGFNQPGMMTDDKELAVLKQDSRYASVLEQITRNEKPCGFDPEFRQFDFWIGNWEVYYGGALAGTSRVELILKDCVIVENWDSTAYGSSGKSYNVYNPGLKKWQQFWVDDSAGPTLYTGDYVNGEMRFVSEKLNADGTKTIMKMTFYNLGADKVRQFIQQSNDDGKTWGTYFDGEYRRVTAKVAK